MLSIFDKVINISPRFLLNLTYEMIFRIRRCVWKYDNNIRKCFINVEINTENSLCNSKCKKLLIVTCDPFCSECFIYIYIELFNF
ncbi:unnamed protein product, partial [Hymenolepis diminuta]